MAQIIDNDRTFMIWKSVAGPDVHTWPLMQNANNVMILLVGYLMLVLWVLPNFMKHRKPFVLKNLIVLHNFIQVLMSIFLVYKVVSVGIPFRDLFSDVCHHRVNETRERHNIIAGTLWWYLIGKILELPDTIFFVLRKKFSQVSFFHVYHHASTFALSWFILKVGPESNCLYVIAVNSFIHIFMYFYYAVSAMGPQYAKYLWWKKYITIAQLAQAWSVLCHTILSNYSNCKYSPVVQTICYFNSFMMIYQFTKFYASTYGKRKIKSE